MAFKIKESFQIGSKTVLDANANLSVLNAVIQSAAGKDTIEILGNGNSSSNKLSLTSATLTNNRTITFPDKTGTVALLDDVQSGATLTDPVIDNIKASSATAATDLWSEVTTGSITIGTGLTTGALNIAASGTGATPIAIGHTNATIGLTGNTTITGTASVTSTLGVTGITTLTGALNANGGIAVDSTAFTVADTTGNVVTAGTLSAAGDFKVNTNKFVVTASSGDTTVAGTLGVAGALNANGGIAVDSTAFTVADTTGNVVTAGTLSAAGDFKINTDKFTVTASTGNTTVAGTLTVTGNLTINGTTSTINSTTVTIDDPIFTLGGDTAPAIDDNKDRGIEFRWHNGSVAKVGFFGFDDSTSELMFIPDATNTSEVFTGTDGVLRGSQLKSTIASGTAPLLVTSNTLVSNLNSDLLDGQEGSYYLNYQNFSNVPSTYTPNVNNFGTIVVSGQSDVVADAVSDTLTLVAGQVDTTSGITISTNATNDTITIAHANTSSVSNLSSDNSSNTFVQDVSFTFDTYGHVTAASVATAAVSINDGTLTLATSGNGLSGSQSFTANQSGNGTFTVTSNATNASTASTIVFRDANADFAANIVTVEGINKDSTVYSKYATATVATTDSTAIDTWAKATYRSCKYVVQITQGTNYQVSEMLVVHNGTAATTTEYAVVETNGSLGTLGVTVDGTNVSLNVVMGSASSSAIKIDKTLIAI